MLVKKKKEIEKIDKIEKKLYYTYNNISSYNMKVYTNCYNHNIYI